MNRSISALQGGSELNANVSSNLFFQDPNQTMGLYERRISYRFNASKKTFEGSLKEVSRGDECLVLRTISFITSAALKIFNWAFAADEIQPSYNQNSESSKNSRFRRASSPFNFSDKHMDEIEQKGGAVMVTRPRLPGKHANKPFNFSDKHMDEIEQMGVAVMVTRPRLPGKHANKPFNFSDKHMDEIEQMGVAVEVVNPRLPGRHINQPFNFSYEYVKESMQSGGVAKVTHPRLPGRQINQPFNFSHEHVKESMQSGGVAKVDNLVDLCNFCVSGNIFECLTGSIMWKQNFHFSTTVYARPNSGSTKDVALLLYDASSAGFKVENNGWNILYYSEENHSSYMLSVRTPTSCNDCKYDYLKSQLPQIIFGLDDVSLLISILFVSYSRTTNQEAYPVARPFLISIKLADIFSSNSKQIDCNHGLLQGFLMVELERHKQLDKELRSPAINVSNDIVREALFSQGIRANMLLRLDSFGFVMHALNTGNDVIIARPLLAVEDTNTKYLRSRPLILGDSNIRGDNEHMRIHRKVCIFPVMYVYNLTNGTNNGIKFILHQDPNPKFGVKFDFLPAKDLHCFNIRFDQSEFNTFNMLAANYSNRDFDERSVVRSIVSFRFDDRSRTKEFPRPICYQAKFAQTSEDRFALSVSIDCASNTDYKASDRLTTFSVANDNIHFLSDSIYENTGKEFVYLMDHRYGLNTLPALGSQDTQVSRESLKDLVAVRYHANSTSGGNMTLGSVSFFDGSLAPSTFVLLNITSVSDPGVFLRNCYALLSGSSVCRATVDNEIFNVVLAFRYEYDDLRCIGTCADGICSDKQMWLKQYLLGNEGVAFPTVTVGCSRPIMLSLVPFRVDFQQNNHELLGGVAPIFRVFLADDLLNDVGENARLLSFINFRPVSRDFAPNLGVIRSVSSTKAPKLLATTPSNVSTTPSNVSTTAPSNVGTTPSNVRTTAPSNVGTTAPSNVGTTPPSNVSTTPSNVSTTFSNVRTTAPSNVGTAPSNVSTAPSNVSTTPSNASNVSTTPSNVSTTPSNASNVGTTPSNVSTTPSNVGTTPSNVRTTAPSNVGTTAPSNVGTTPPSNVSTTPSNVSTTFSNVRTTAPSNVGTTPSNVSTTPSNVSTTPSNASNVGTTPSNVSTTAPSNVGTTTPSNVSTTAPSNVSTTPSNVGTTAPSNVGTTPSNVRTTAPSNVGTTPPSNVGTTPSNVRTAFSNVSTTPSNVSTTFSNVRTTAPSNVSTTAPSNVGTTPSSAGTAHVYILAPIFAVLALLGVYFLGVYFYCLKRKVRARNEQERNEQELILFGYKPQILPDTERTRISTDTEQFTIQIDESSHSVRLSERNLSCNSNNGSLHSLPAATSDNRVSSKESKTFSLSLQSLKDKNFDPNLQSMFHDVEEAKGPTIIGSVNSVDLDLDDAGSSLLCSHSNAVELLGATPSRI